MATYTSLINSVLVRLREGTIAAPTDSTYSLLIGEFVNEAKREVEDSWKWNALRQTIQVSTADGTSQYAVTGIGDRFKLQDKDFSVYNLTEEEYIRRASPTWVKRQAITNTDKDRPFYFYFEGRDINGDTYVNFWQTPNGVYTINFNVVVPQTDFTLGSEVLSVPHWPVILSAHAKGIAERGEDGSTQHQEASAVAKKALEDAISIDEAKILGETDWYA